MSKQSQEGGLQPLWKCKNSEDSDSTKPKPKKVVLRSSPCGGKRHKQGNRREEGQRKLLVKHQDHRSAVVAKIYGEAPSS